MSAVTTASPPKRSLFKPSLDWLLIFVPIAIALRFLSPNPTWLFITACLAVVPLAGWMGHATEHLATKVGEGIGGLLNATFGNAAELIIALIALQKGLTGVVEASITGSIIGNVLLVLGLSLFCGGLKYRTQKFNRTVARSSGTSLLMAAGALVIPAVYHHVAAGQQTWTNYKEQRLSLAIAIVLFVTYIATLLFSLKTHKELFSGQNEADAEAEANAAEFGEEITEPHDAQEEWSLKRSILTLIGATVFVAIMSEFLVGSIEEARVSLGVSETFVGVIVVAIIGNAAEHSTAVMSALKDKNDLAVGIAVGSSIQIALFVAPVLVFASYFFGHPIDLEFSIAEIVAVIVAVGISVQTAGDGESNWLEGAQLLAVYAILGILFYFVGDAHAIPATAAH